VRTLIVTLLAAMLLAASMATAFAQESADSPDGVDSTIADVAQDQPSDGTTDDGGTNWVRMVGLAGIVAIWWVRGFSWVSKRRKARVQGTTADGQNGSARDEGVDAAEQSRHLIEPERPGTA
jgi:hypothetical protein